MSYLLDTNVVSESLRTKPSKSVLTWLDSVPVDSLHISVISLGEIRRGVERLEQGKRKRALGTWLEHDLPAWFGSRVLCIDTQVADRWGYLIAATKKTLPAIDGLLAATALAHNLKMVTRNVADFKISGLEVINPWE